MDTLENMRLFVRVVEAGSFTKAATLAGIGTAQVSRSIAELETRLRTRLLNRTTRHMSLTEAGERYLQRCDQILSYVDLAEAEAAGSTALPTGRLRVHSTTGFGQHYMAPILGHYAEQFPDVALDLVLGQRMPDIIEEGIDVSFVVANDLEDSALISQRVCQATMVLCASPQYVAKRGAPQSLDDLNDHVCLQLLLPDMPRGKWVFDPPGHSTLNDSGDYDIDEADAPTFRLGRTAPLTVNVSEALAETLRAGMGIAPLPLSVALPGMRDGSLMRVLPQYRLRPTQIFALYASRRYLDAKIKTFVDFVRDRVPEVIAAQEREIEVLCRNGAASMR